MQPLSECWRGQPSRRQLSGPYWEPFYLSGNSRGDKFHRRACMRMATTLNLCTVTSTQVTGVPKVGPIVRTGARKLGSGASKRN